MKILYKALTTEKLIELGFKEENDGSGDPRGTDWNIRNEHFHLWIDAYCDVYLSRVNPDTDQITLSVDTLFELEQAVDFIKD